MKAHTINFTAAALMAAPALVGLSDLLILVFTPETYWVRWDSGRIVDAAMSGILAVCSLVSGLALLKIDRECERAAIAASIHECPPRPPRKP